ncbi:hypothetical protein Moror_14353 [Moniliophthora roreri MCA 2997]|uniref:Uncharacterized protein n=1 Tax=Moniliophthora roreri (strain MCA 2997) TaxID=1381753 RepID=V2YSL4_MONRO|nr:hypothetical protein Moror_14353 [Moniliophthora roreri MCA 2997]KAI3604902.1 hypothetical protein WG66_008666 [Moniliophthora roreri]
MQRSRATLPSLEASQQAHIDDLVQRNRTLEHTIKKLTEEVKLEKTRAKTTIKELQTKWQDTKEREWREGVDVLQACHQIAQLRTQAEVEREKMNALKEQDVTRREKAARLQRETAITKFQIRESELERKIMELEEEAEMIRSGREDELKEWKDKCAELIANAQHQEELLQAAEQEQQSLQDQLAELLKSSAENKVSSESTAARLERLSLQLDGERTKNTDLERANDELRRTNDDLKRQIDKWQTLETKGGAEMESLRKKKVELEVQVQALQNQLSKREEDDSRTIEREKQKVKNIKTNMDEWQERAKDMEAERNDLETQCNDLKKALAKSDKDNAKLRAQLNALRTASKEASLPPTRKKPKSPELLSEEVVEVAMEQAQRSSPVVPPSGSQTRASSSKTVRQNERSRAQSPPRGEPIPEDDEIEEISPPTKTKGRGKEKAVESDAEAKPKQATRRKPNSRAKTATQQSDAEIEIEEIPSPQAATKGKGSRAKRNAPTASEGEGEEPASQPKRRKRNEASVEQSNLKPKAKAKASKPPSRTASSDGTASKETDESASNLATKPKKTRRINLYNNAGGSTAIPSFNFADAPGGLNIPTVLSPVREEDAPASSFGGRTFSMLKQSFSFRR